MRVTAQAQPSPAQAEQHWPKLEKPAQVGAIRFSAGVSSRLVVEAAQRLYEFESTPEKEAERPEVVARVDGTDEDWFIQPEDETELHSEGLLFAGCELGRMIDFDRIVGELRADRDSWAEQAEQRLADWDEMRKERDAALARVAEMEACGAPALLAAADYFAERAKGPSPGWVTLSAVAKDLRVRADKATVAQDQHSAPDVSGCRRNRSALTDAQMRRLYDNSTEIENERLGFEAFARLIRRAEAVHQIAAAPGKEGV